MGSFSKPCGCCEDEEPAGYLQARLCSDNSTVDLWFVRNSNGTIVTTGGNRELTFYFRIGTDYYYVPDVEPSDTPGTLATGYVEVEDCNCGNFSTSTWVFTWIGVINCNDNSFSISRESLVCGSPVVEGLGEWRQVDPGANACVYRFKLLGPCCADPDSPPAWPEDPEQPIDASCCQGPPTNCFFFCGDELICPDCPVLMSWDLSPNTENPFAPTNPESGTALLFYQGGMIWSHQLIDSHGTLLRALNCGFECSVPGGPGRTVSAGGGGGFHPSVAPPGGGNFGDVTPHATFGSAHNTKTFVVDGNDYIGSFTITLLC